MVGWHANVCYHPVMVELFNVSNATMCGTLTLKSASQDGHGNVAKFQHVWWTLKLRLKSSLEKWFHSEHCNVQYALTARLGSIGPWHSVLKLLNQKEEKTR